MENDKNVTISYSEIKDIKTLALSQSHFCMWGCGFFAINTAITFLAAPSIMMGFASVGLAFGAIANIVSHRKLKRKLNNVSDSTPKQQAERPGNTEQRILCPDNTPK